MNFAQESERAIDVSAHLLASRSPARVLQFADGVFDQLNILFHRVISAAHDCSRIPAAWIFSYTHSGRQRSVLSARQLEWQTIVAT